MDDVYVKLREKFESLGFGYTESTLTGAEYPLLTTLFTPEEAKIIIALPNGYHTVPEIADILGLPVDETHEKIETMSLRGNLFRLRHEDAEDEYRTVPIVHGIFEFSIPRATPDWCLPMAGHLMQGGWGQQVYGTDTPLLRVIPHAGTIEEGTDTMLIDDIDELVKSKKKCAVSICLCRKLGDMAHPDAPCEKTRETCMTFDEFADFYVENGIAHYITTDEALDLVHRSADECLVHQVGTSQRGEVLCNCCSCDCAVLACKKAFGGPAEANMGNYYAVHDADLCTLCGTCVERCPMGAITVEGNAYTLDTDKCIGCGSCSTGCAQDAIKLRKKDADKFYSPPCETIFDSYSLQQQYRGYPA